jgi:integrase
MVINALSRWKDACPKGELDLVFPNGRANVESLTNIWHRFWTPLQLKCGIASNSGKVGPKGQPILVARYGFHMLRHAAASLLLPTWDGRPKRVQTVMGHSSVTMTFDLYGHLYESADDDREAMKKVEAAVVAA